MATLQRGPSTGICLKSLPESSPRPAHGFQGRARGSLAARSLDRTGLLAVGLILEASVIPNG